MATQADRAARLAKADLVTGMVGEFPELQGLMGGYYAAAQGEHPAVATAIRDHYKPVGQGDDVPTDPVTVAVSLADKLDTVVAFFEVNILPTGSKDPFALRRAALGVNSIIIQNGLRCGLNELFFQAGFQVFEQELQRSDEYDQLYIKRYPDIPPPQVLDIALREEMAKLGFQEPFDYRDIPRTERAPAGALFSFLIDRLKVQQREAGVRHDLIDAVFALGGEDDLVRLLARVHALQAFVTTEDGANLLAGYKRAANILKKEAPSAPSPPQGDGRGEGRGEGLPSSAAPGTAPHHDPIPAGEREQETLSYTPEPAETALMTALDSAEPRATAAIAREDFAAAMAALASLRAPIDAFFDSVIVNDSDPAKRSARLALLERVRAAVHNVADFSKIEG